MTARVLVIAEASPGCGGTDLGCRAIAGLGGASEVVEASSSVSGPDLAAQVRAAFAESPVGALHIGRLSAEPTVDRVADLLLELAVDLPLVLDPGVARDDMPLDPAVMAAVKRRLAHHATVLAASLADAARLTGMEIRDLDEMRMAAQMLLTVGPGAVFLTAGDLVGGVQTEVLATEAGCETFSDPRPLGVPPDGVGHALSSVVALGLAQKMPVPAAVTRARRYVYDGGLLTPA